MLLPSLLLIAIIVLAYSIFLFQTQLSDDQKQIVNLQNELVTYENSTARLQQELKSLETELLNLKNPTYNVTIESVSSDSWYVPVGVAMFKEIYINIRNVGVRDVGGLTFKFEILVNGTIWASDSYTVGMIAPLQLGVLHVQESATIVARITSSVNVPFDGKIFAITVMLDETVLDESTLILSNGLFG